MQCCLYETVAVVQSEKSIFFLCVLLLVILRSDWETLCFYSAYHSVTAFQSTLGSFPGSMLVSMCEPDAVLVAMQSYPSTD